MILHSYLTDGFYPWAEFYLESLRRWHPNIPVLLSTRNLKPEQIRKLESVHNVTVENEDLTYEKLAKRANLDLNQMMKLKNEVETVHVTDKNKIWKLMIAADDRVKCMVDVVKRMEGQVDYVLHTDIDMYFRSKLDDLFDIASTHDVSLRFRLKSKESRKILISVQAYKPCQSSYDFLDRWVKYIDDITPPKRPLGYGQTSCYYAYRDFVNKIDWGKIPARFATAQWGEKDVIWAANTMKGKTENLKTFRQDFIKIS